MIGFAILAGYLAGFVLMWRIAYSRLIDHDLSEHPNIPVDWFDNALIGILFAMMWPFVAVIWLPAQWVIRPTARQQQIARERALEVELAEVKSKAREYGLPL